MPRMGCWASVAHRAQHAGCAVCPASLLWSRIQRLCTASVHRALRRRACVTANQSTGLGKSAVHLSCRSRGRGLAPAGEAHVVSIPLIRPMTDTRACVPRNIYFPSPFLRSKRATRERSTMCGRWPLAWPRRRACACWRGARKRPSRDSRRISVIFDTTRKRVRCMAGVRALEGRAQAMRDPGDHRSRHQHEVPLGPYPMWRSCLRSKIRTSNHETEA
jgi:hypothetical protein